jgi:hypothetical protein
MAKQLAVVALFVSYAFAIAAGPLVPKPSDKIPSIVHQAISSLATAGPRAYRGPLRVRPDAKVKLELHAAAAVSGIERSQVESLGAEVELSTGDIGWAPGLQPPSRFGVIVAWVPAFQVSAVAALPWVVAVRPVEQNPPDAGTFLSEGVELHRADIAHLAGVDGTGVTVGVISDDVRNLAIAQASGDVPAGVNVIATGGCAVTNPGDCDEGTAMLEIVHDMAPGAALAFHETGAGTVGHIVAQNALVAAAVDVIAEDIAFDAEPVFQKGAVATNGDMIAGGGISVHSSAGNLGDSHAARVAAVPVAPTDLVGFAGCVAFGLGSNVVDIDPGVGTSFDVSIPPMTTASFSLQWSEPRAIFPTAGAGGFTDLDLHVMDAAGTACVTSSTMAQGNGAGDTIEQVGVTNPNAVAVGAKIVVSHAGSLGAVAPPIIDVRWRDATAIDPTTRASSLNPDSNYTGDATSSAAANAGPQNLGAGVGSTDPTVAPLELFSAGGPVQLLLTTVCPGHPATAAYPCPGGGVAGPPGSSLGAPDWTAADGTSVSGAGGFGRGTCPAVNQGDCVFFGTSAAAPHAAGCDALVRQAFPGPITVPMVNTILSQSAVDRGPAGFDNEWGAGVLQCFPFLREHYLCYNAKDLNDPPQHPEPVNLIDQFHHGAYKTGHARRFCTPVNKNDEGIIDATTHLKVYELQREVAPVVQAVVNTENQFGTLTLRLRQPANLYVPSSKGLTAPPDPPDPTLPGFEHFMCYKVQNVGPKFPSNVIVELENQFGAGKYRLRKPRRLCAPVAKQRPSLPLEPINNPVRHLVCYGVRPIIPLPPAEQVYANNQFGIERLQLKREREFCVPSFKTVVGGSTTTTTIVVTTTTTSSTSTTTTTVPTLCCDVPPGALGNPVPVCFVATPDPVLIDKCQLLGGIVSPGVCDPDLERCVPAPPVPASDFCCECPVPAPPFPHPQVCYDGVTGHEFKCQPPCVLHPALTCGPSSEQCGGSPSGAFIDTML